MRTSSTPVSPLWLANGICAGIAVAVSHWFIWVYAPVEQTMGIVQKIFYMHMPLAWWGLFSFLTVFLASIAYLIRRDPKWDRLAGAAAEVGVLFTALALATGMLWARPAWNVWWTWDPRLTTTLIMWFVYCAYLIVRRMGLSPDRQATVCAVLGVVAFLDVPLVFYASRLWRSIHPNVLAAKGGGLEPEMLTTLMVSLGAWVFVWLGLVSLRYAQADAASKLRRLVQRDEL